MPMASGPDRYLVVGNPIAHSRSPEIHAAFAAQTGQHILYERRLIETDPPEAFAAAMLAAPQRLLPFVLFALPLVYLLNFARFIGETVWYIGLDTLRQMHDVMLPMMLAQLRDNLDAREIAAIALNITLVLAAIVLYGALRTVTAKNPVHAALHLVLTFCVSAMIWMLMQAEFLGVTLVVVYVGAVMVLFLFVVMMLNIDIEEMRAGFWRHAPVAGVVGTLLAVALILILVNPKTDLAAFGLMKDIPADYNNIRDLGSRIYTDYLLPFELAAVLLLLGMVAAIALVHRKTTNPKRMDPADQVKVRADQGRMRLVKMEAVKLQTESAEENEVSDDLKLKEEGKA